MRGDRPGARAARIQPVGAKSTRLRGRPRSHRLLAALPAAAAVLAVVHVARIALGPAGSWERSAADARLYAAAIIICGLAALGRAGVDRSDRAAWGALGIGLVGYGTVSVVAAPHLQHGMASFTPSAALLWLTFYPFLIACVVLLARSRADRFDAGLVIDGLIGGVTLAAVAAEVGLKPLLHHTHMRLGGVAVDGVWLASDLAVLGIMAGCAALAASRGQRERWLLFAGAAVLAAADALSLYHSTATIAGLPGGWRQTLVPVAAVLMATAAIIPAGRAHPSPARPVVGFTAVFALIAVTLQALDLIHAANPVAMALSVLVLLGVAMRVSLSFRSLRESEQLRVALLDAEEQRRMVLNQMLSAEADERARIAEELHDDTVQVLTATLVSLDRQRLSGDRGAYEASAEAGRRARDTLALALERTRRLMFELRPPLLEAHGLAPAVRDLVEHANHELGLEVAVSVEVPRYAEAFETLVYRIVREAVANVRRHARARRLEVTLIHTDGELRGTIADDGLGFDVHRALDRHRTRMHLGLDATIERIRLAGGAIDIDSSPGEGTRLEFRLPSAGSEAEVETPDVVAVSA
jgi:signal transduction histidine kinase